MVFNDFDEGVFNSKCHRNQQEYTKMTMILSLNSPYKDNLTWVTCTQTMTVKKMDSDTVDLVCFSRDMITHIPCLHMCHFPHPDLAQTLSPKENNWGFPKVLVCLLEGSPSKNGAGYKVHSSVSWFTIWPNIYIVYIYIH